MAIGALRALREHGLKVPEQVSVIGFDDIPLAAYFDPPLTTIQQNMHALGQEAARLLLLARQGEQVCSHHILVSPRLVVRHSTQAL